MPPVAYATQDDFEAYVEGWETGDPDVLDRLLERSSRDLDWILGDYGGLIETGDFAGMKLDPDELDYSEKTALVRATCAQAEYRNEMGERFFVRAQHPSVGGPDFSTQGKLPYIGPKVWRELSGSGLVLNTTTLHGRDARPPWFSFTHNDGDGLPDEAFG